MKPTMLMRRSLDERPQLLGFLPTIWFWNDTTSQQLLRPLSTVVMVPMGVLTVFLTVWSGVSIWFWLSFQAVISFIMMGVVERFIRKQLRLRAPSREGQGAPLPKAAGASFLLMLAAIAGIFTLLLFLQASTVVLGVAVMSSVALLIGTVWRSYIAAQVLPPAAGKDSPMLPDSESRAD